MRRNVIIGVIVVVVVVAGWVGYSLYAESQTAATAQLTAAQSGQADPQTDLSNVIWASGNLAPKQWAALSPAAAGTLHETYVTEGEWVESETLLLSLDNGILQSQATVAAAAMAESIAAQAKLLAGATEADLAASRAEVAAAQAGVTSAEAQLLQIQSNITAAEAQVTIAQAQYNQLASGPTAAEIAASQAEVDVAQAGVTHAQAAYNLVRGDPNIGARPESLQLQQATESYKAAQARYAAATQGATPQQLAVANAQIVAAKSQVEVVRSQGPAAQATILSTQAQLAGAQARMDALVAGATREEREIALARVQSAQAQLASAQAQLGQAQIVAPFPGQVGRILVRPGELASPGSATVMLGDTRDMHVETTDLREGDVTRLTVGLPVEVTFDALPDRIFTGEIAAIAPMSSSDKGSTNFKVEIDVADLDPSLRWGMTAFVNIQVGR